MALPLLHLNVGLNALRLEGPPTEEQLPRVSALEWGDSEAAAALTEGHRFDLIIGSDIIYEPENHEALLASMALLAYGDTPGHPHPPVPVLIAAADWSKVGQTCSRYMKEGWLATAERLGWRWEVIRTIREDEAQAMRLRLKQKLKQKFTSDSQPMQVVIMKGTAPMDPRAMSMMLDPRFGAARPSSAFFSDRFQTF